MMLNPYHPSWFHLVPFMNHFRLGEYDRALAAAHLFNYPTLPWDPLMKAAALVRLGRDEEAGLATGRLLELVPDFAATGRDFIRGYVKVESLVEEILQALREAGLPDHSQGPGLQPFSRLILAPSADNRSSIRS